MGSVYSGGGSSGKSAYADAGGAPASGAAPAHHGGGSGVLKFVEHLGSDAKNAVTGLGEGGAQLATTIYKGDLGVVTGNQKEQQAASDQFGRVVKSVGKSYAQTYGPLVHGHAGEFFHGVEQHPLGPLLDAATIATLGAGGVAKAGQILSKAGAISESSRLARLGHSIDLTVPDFAKAAGQKGESIVVKQSSANPLIRGRQVATNEALKKLPESTPVVGNTARAVKALSRQPERAAARLAIKAQPFEAAFGKLSPAEKAAWHLTARGVHPADYRAFLKSQDSASPAMLKLLSNPKVARFVEQPSARLQDALAKGRALSDELTRLKVKAGHITDSAAAESPYRLLRMVNGASFSKAGELVDTKGRDIPTLASELAAKGKQQPFYVPDSAVTSRDRIGRFTSRPTGFAEPAKSGASKRNLGVLASQGKLAFNENPLGREASRFRNFTEASLLHDELVKHAAELPKGAPLPVGYEYLKLNRGEAAAPYTERIGAEFEHALEPGTADNFLTANSRDTNLAPGKTKGSRLVVPSSVRSVLENRSLTYHGAAHRLLYNQPTSVWKHLVLGLRPAFFANITVGNSILGALQMAPGLHGISGWLNQVVPGAEKVLGSKLKPETMAEVLPEQATGTFGHSAGYTSNRGVSVARKVAQGVMPATIAYENILRRAMAEGWAKALPEVREAMRRNGGDVNAALREVAQTDPHVIDNISKRIDDALGNYRTYNKFERALKQFIPFYGWDRHIVRSASRLALERPALVNALRALGTEGHQYQDETLGELPSYMQGDVRLPGLPSFLGPLNGRVPVLQTRSLNPFNTLADLGEIPKALIGRPGAGSDVLSSGLNPFIQALLEQATGRSLLSGAPIKRNAFANFAGSVPQLTTLEALFGKTPKAKPTSLYQNDAGTRLANFLGVPVKKVASNTAHLYASEEGKPRR